MRQLQNHLGKIISFFQKPFLNMPLECSHISDLILITLLRLGNRDESALKDYTLIGARPGRLPVP
jgi:hypothetical protein